MWAITLRRNSPILEVWLAKVWRKPVTLYHILRFKRVILYILRIFWKYNCMVYNLPLRGELGALAVVVVMTGMLT